MTHDIPELDKDGLRKFGWQTGAIIIVLFGLFFPWLLHLSDVRLPFYIGGVLIAWALLHPLSLNPLYKIWMTLAMAIGGVMNRIILSIVFYVVVTPMGFIMRLSGYRPMKDDLDAHASSYRVKSKQAKPKGMERPF